MPIPAPPAPEAELTGATPAVVKPAPAPTAAGGLPMSCPSRSASSGVRVVIPPDPGRDAARTIPAPVDAPRVPGLSALVGLRAANGAAWADRVAGPSIECPFRALLSQLDPAAADFGVAALDPAVIEQAAGACGA